MVDRVDLISVTKFTLTQWRQWVGFGIYLTISVITGSLVSYHVPDPYMDELFHLPQAQLYCRHDWGYYDPKLTTPPGLYILSLPFSWWLGCETSSIRLTNMVLGATLYWVWGILLFDSPPTLTLGSPGQVSSWVPPLTTLAASLFPISFFFHHMFYTDTASTLTIALSLLLTRYRLHWFSAMFGLISLTIRQTNIVWVGFLLVWSVIDSLITGPTKDSCQSLASPPGRWVELESLLRRPKVLLVAVLTNFRTLFPVVLPYTLVLVLFGIFIKWNGGIVLGDKTNHVVSLHLPQIGYFLVFSSVLLWPHIVDRLTLASPFLLVKEFLVWTASALTRTGSATCLVLLLTGITWSIHTFTIHHPFILSDNRHITFYLWKNLFRRHSILPYLYTPLYFAAGWVWYQKFYRPSRHPILFWVGYLFVIVLTLVPTPLLELRYFIPHFLFLRVILLPLPPSSPRIIVEILGYLLLHVTLLYRFLYHPFAWPSEPGRPQRLMW